MVNDCVTLLSIAHAAQAPAINTIPSQSACTRAGSEPEDERAGEDDHRAEQGLAGKVLAEQRDTKAIVHGPSRFKSNEPVMPDTRSSPVSSSTGATIPPATITTVIRGASARRSRASVGERRPTTLNAAKAPSRAGRRASAVVRRRATPWRVARSRRRTPRRRVPPADLGARMDQMSSRSNGRHSDARDGRRLAGARLACLVRPGP